MRMTQHRVLTSNNDFEYDMNRQCEEKSTQLPLCISNNQETCLIM